MHIACTLLILLIKVDVLKALFCFKTDKSMLVTSVGVSVPISFVRQHSKVTNSHKHHCNPNHMVRDEFLTPYIVSKL